MDNSIKDLQTQLKILQDKTSSEERKFNKMLKKTDPTGTRQRLKQQEERRREDVKKRMNEAPRYIVYYY